jgi:hypothetical protein
MISCRKRSESLDKLGDEQGQSLRSECEGKAQGSATRYFQAIRRRISEQIFPNYKLYLEV